MGGGHAGEAHGDIAAAREQEVAQTRAQGGHDEAGIVGAVDDDAVAELALDRVPEADPGEVRHVGSGDQHGPGRGGQCPPRLVQIVDEDDQGEVSAATPGSSLPSSHSRKAPPAVET